MKIVLAGHMSRKTGMTGAERNLRDAAGILVHGGHEVIAAVPAEGRAAAALRDMGLTVRIFPLARLWILTGGFIGPLRILRFWLSFPAAWSFRRWLRAEGPDAVYVNAVVNVWAAWAAWSTGIPVIWSLHEIPPAGWRGRTLAALVRRMAARAICPSHAVAAAYPGFPAGHLHVVPWGIPRGTSAPLLRAEMRSRFAVTEGDFCMLWAGHDAGPKGAEDFIRAAAMLDAGKEPVRALLAGKISKRWRRRLMRLAAGKARPVFLGYRGDMECVMSACDVFVMTSRLPEAFPYVVLEAMAAGLPVAAYAVGGVPEMVEDGVTGFLVEPGRPEKMAQALRILLGKPDLRARMGEAARKRAAEHFSMERFRERLAQICDELAPRNGR